MKWVTYRSGDKTARAGLVVGDEIYGLPPPYSVRGLLGDDGESLAEAADVAQQTPAEVVELGAAHLNAPLEPYQIRDFLTFLDHLRNARGGPQVEIEDIWEHIPAFYFSNIAAVVGPYDPVPIAPGSRWFDFELEVAAVIGKKCSDVRPEHGEAQIVGFTILCDWSARDLQYREMELGLGPAKGKDGATTLGPMLVTVDELEPYRQNGVIDLCMQAWINGEPVTDGSLAQMDWTWGEMVAYASRGTTLHPGDVIGSGTVPMGCLIEHYQTRGPEFPGWLEVGDTVRLEVEGLGVTEQEIQAAPELHSLRSIE